MKLKQLKYLLGTLTMYSLIKLVLTLFIYIVTNVKSFNVDTDFPIIYFDTNKNAEVNKSYFGYSVILYAGDDATKPWIQIGAPRGHDSQRYGFFQPGLVYRCPISQPCKLLMIDAGVNATTNKVMEIRNNIYIAKKDNAWIGASMDIDSKHKRIVTCGPRWINKVLDYHIEGACYWSKIGDNETKALLPLTNSNYYAKYKVYNFPMGQAGMSVHFPKSTNPQVVIGAPGVYNWKGTVVSYQDDKIMEESEFGKLIIPDAYKIKDVYAFGYLGYSISSGNFFSRKMLAYVAGAPRSATYKGQILVFKYATDFEDEIAIMQTHRGETMGEYFGAAIGVADINGDHLDDLIVGAPHYTTKYDEGRIYIFYGSSHKKLQKPNLSPEITGNYSGGQFGTAIQSLGDIDGDDCDDIAVGAPYENEEHGVIYIYNGHKKGVPLKLSQRIEGKQLYSNLYGFGVSFSKPTDIDNNNFNDFAVGSFLSDNAVILRMRPTVVLDMKVNSLESKLDRKSTQFTIKACFQYNGRNLPSSLNISRKIILDKNHRRAYRNGELASSMEYTDVIQVYNNKTTCENISINIKTMQNRMTGWEPIEIIVLQDLVEKKINSTPIFVRSTVENEDRFCNTCPVVNRALSLQEDKIEVPYALNCGTDDKCDADLQVLGKFIGLKQDKFVIGLNKTISLEITVLNKKEPAYLTEVEVILPENVYLSVKLAECDEKNIKNQLIIICHIDNPLDENKTKTISLDLDMEAITNSKQRKISFVITAKSSSDDINMEDNSITKNLVLVTEANIKIIGKTETSMFYFGSDSSANTTHVYEVHKSGVSPLNEFKLNVSIPVAYKKEDTEIHFMAIHKPRSFQDKQILTCDWPEEYIKETEVLEVENAIQNMNQEQNITKKKRSVSEDFANNNDTFSFAAIDKILFINCSMPEVICRNVSCTVGPFRQSLRGASLQIKMVMNMTQIIKHILGNNKNIYLSTDGIVKEIEGPVFRKDEVRVSTAFVKEPEVHKVDSWIIIVAIVSGILILLLIILGLVKAGFFERKDKQKLELLKQAEVEQDFNIREPSTECVSENEDE